jgi:hypothetical protein
MAISKVESGKGYALYDDETILLKGVRLSFPHIVTTYNENSGSYGFKLMVPKEQTEMIGFLKKEIRKKFEELKVKKLPFDKLFMRDGDDSERESENGYYVLSGNSKRPLTALDRNGHIMDDHDEIVDTFYSGCYVNAVIKLWAQNSKEFGKRVNANANAVQFVRDGEVIGVKFDAKQYDWDNYDEEEDRTPPKSRKSRLEEEEDELPAKHKRKPPKSREYEDEEDDDFM